jgi:hypothetical protein
MYPNLRPHLVKDTDGSDGSVKSASIHRPCRLDRLYTPLQKCKTIAIEDSEEIRFLFSHTAVQKRALECLVSSLKKNKTDQ